MSRLANFLMTMNLRKFDGEPPATPPTTPPATPPAAPSGKTYSEDYVKDLRDEAKTHRVAKQEHEKTLRTILGLKDGDSITSDHVTAYQANLTKTNADALSKANDRLISAEIRLLEGYNHKLLEKLVDRTKLTISDAGDVTGLKEAAEALLTEFPEIKKAAAGGTGGANPPGGGSPTELQALETAYAEAVKAGNMPLQISLKNKIFDMQKKKG